VASDPSSALALAQEVETLAAQYAAALAVGPPHLLSDEEMTRVLERFRDYRQPDAT
jgi:L-fuculose-phosphate aldolase